MADSVKKRKSTTSKTVKSSASSTNSVKKSRVKSSPQISKKPNTTSKEVKASAEKTSNKKKIQSANITNQILIGINGVFIVTILALVIAMFVMTRDRVNENTNSLNTLSDKIDRIENRISDTPSKTRNLLIYGDENVDQEPPASTSIEDEPTLGNIENAKVAVVEFSDLNCPFCKRFSQETFPLLEQQFIETDEVVFVHKDFPSVGNEAEQQVHSVAECVRKELGDVKYFQFIDEIYANEGNTTKEQAIEKANKEYGIFVNTVESCSNSQVIIDKIREDALEAQNQGFQGTPSFIIGRIIDGRIVEGETLVGAQPYNAFVDAINRQLEQ